MMSKFKSADFFRFLLFCCLLHFEFLHCAGDLGLRDDGVTLENGPRFPSVDSHDHAFSMAAVLLQVVNSRLGPPRKVSNDENNREGTKIYRKKLRNPEIELLVYS